MLCGARKSCALVAALAALVLTAAAALPASGRAASDALTRHELGKLASGKLVVRTTEHRERGARYIGGSSWQVINAPPDVVWQAILDTRYYTRMMPQVHQAKLVKRTGKRRVVYIRHVTGPIDTSYYLIIDLDNERREIRFKLDETRDHDLRAAYGIYAIRSYGRGKTLLAYSIKANIGGGLLSMLVEPLVHEWMLKVPWTVKRFVEGSGRWIYDFKSAAR